MAQHKQMQLFYDEEDATGARKGDEMDALDSFDWAVDGAEVKPGDVYALGAHRLMCGDSTSARDVAELMAGEKADIVFTDPPYGMKKEKDGVLNDNLNYDALLEFNKAWFALAFDALKDTGWLFCWGIDEPLMDMYSNIIKPLKKQNKCMFRNYITWAKHSAIGIGGKDLLKFSPEAEKCILVMKGQDWNNNNAEFFNTKFQRILDYMESEAKRLGITPKDIREICGVQMYGHWFTRSQFTIIPEAHYRRLQDRYADRGGFPKPYGQLRQMLGDSNDPTASLKPYFDSAAITMQGGIGLTDVWRFPPTSNVEREVTGGHATPKPIALCCRGIHATSRKGEIVLDLFGGSGSTLIAAEYLKRRCYMMEMDPRYCAVIIRRWEKATGGKAVRISGRGENA